MWLLLVLLLVARADAQIRTGWGWTAPCRVTANTTTTLTEIRFLDNCDMFHAPHIANPFLLMMLSRNWVVSFLVPGIFEIFEIVSILILSNFGYFPGATDSYENLTDSLVDDWLIQAGLGVILGAWISWCVGQPPLWKGWSTRRGLFLAWLVWFLLLMVSQTTFGLKLNDGSDPTGFPLGPTICIGISAVLFAFLVQNEPGSREAWSGRLKSARIAFWVAVVSIYFSFYYVVQFDFFFGSGPQTWLMFGFWMVVSLIAVIVEGRGREVIELLNWQMSYVKLVKTETAQKV